MDSESSVPATPVEASPSAPHRENSKCPRTFDFWPILPATKEGSISEPRTLSSSSRKRRARGVGWRYISVYPGEDGGGGVVAGEEECFHPVMRALVEEVRLPYLGSLRARVWRSPVLDFQGFCAAVLRCWSTCSRIEVSSFL